MLSIIAGKPGSGKTYHMSTLLVDMLTDWVRYELKHGEMYNSTIWTNIVFNEEGLNETISKRIGKDVDAWNYMNYCDGTFFNDPDCVYWWHKFPPQSVIIIDEVHFHLGKKVEYGSLDMEQELINWISTHRHGQQEIYFLSQHTDQFANQILGIADVLLEIVNVKSLHLPFPISIPMSDFEELKRSFGIKTQYYQANVGNFRGKAVRWSGAVDRHMMTQDIFRVYQSHDTGVETSDRPSLKMTPIEGIVWFLRRHGWHLGLKLGGVVLLVFFVPSFLMSIPTLLANSMMGGTLVVQKCDKEVLQPELQDELQRAESKQGADVVGESGLPAKPVVRQLPFPEERAFGADRGALERVSDSIEARVGRREEVKKSVKIVMLYQKGVMLDDGRKIAVGEAFEIDGTEETLSVACAICGVVGFESGKRLRF